MKFRELLEKEKGIYISVKLENINEFIDFFKNQNIEPLPDPHCTIVYSKKSFEHNPKAKKITIKPENFKKIEVFGDAIVMTINSKELQERFNTCILEGASHYFPEYQPHITIFTKENINPEDEETFKMIKLPTFNLIFGEECIEELDEDL